MGPLARREGIQEADIGAVRFFSTPPKVWLTDPPQQSVHAHMFSIQYSKHPLGGAGCVPLPCVQEQGEARLPSKPL